MHVLIVGASYSGKSWLAKSLAHRAINRGENVVVYDPLKSGGWPDGATKYASAEKFLSDIKSVKSAHVFIDEAKTLWNHDTKRADAILYQLRHNGLLVYVIGQRAENMIPPNARNQCSKVYAFKQSKKDAETLSLEYDGDMAQCATLQKTHFVCSDGFVTIKGRLDFATTIPQIVFVDIPVPKFADRKRKLK